MIFLGLVSSKFSKNYSVYFPVYLQVWIGRLLTGLKWKIARLRVKTRATPKNLWVRYLFGLSLIFAVLVISHNNSLSVISAGKEHAQLINMGGQQRTLS